MKRRIICASLLLAALLSGCTLSKRPAQYSVTYLGLFDTVTTITGIAHSESAFLEEAQAIRATLDEYHRLFDIYNSYEGMNNLKTVNDNAGLQPVVVDERLMALLLDCKEFFSLTGGRVNVAMGSLLQLWHEAREAGIADPMNAKLPPQCQLEAAAGHASIDALILDPVRFTAFLSDANMRLDVGAIAKGWAVQEVSRLAPEGYLISVGGNVVATGPKDERGTPWIIGIEDPDGGGYLHTICLSKGSVVTSGDYQRVFQAEGKAYHHIIDPDTWYPSTYWRSVTVVCLDSGLADALSTALFTLPLEAGQELAAQCGAEAMWVNSQQQIFYSPGFQALLQP